MSIRINIMVLNLGSTSSKIAIYNGCTMVNTESVKHTAEVLAMFNSVWDQLDYRKDCLLGVIDRWKVAIEDIDVIACRGGCIKPVPSGIYKINKAMIADIKSGTYGIHPTGLGNIIAFNLGNQFNIPALTVDTPATDELCEEARFSGIPQVTRVSSFHALNQKATARKIASEIGRNYEDLNMIVAHLGGGISVGAHLKGKIVDANNALNGDGPFSPERAGSLPAGDLVALCFSGKYTEVEMKKLLTGRGGLMAYLNTTDAQEVENRISRGDKRAEQVYNAMIYQIAKEIGACAAVLDGEVDAIALTGSLAYSEHLVSRLMNKISFIATVYLNPGENEMQALAEGALRYYSGAEQLSEYTTVGLNNYMNTTEEECTCLRN
jgi:butyrate kinase